jgi:hypothetical protein
MASCAVVFLTCEPTITAPGFVVFHIGVHRLGRHRLRRQFGQRGEQAGGGAEQETLALRARRR